MPFIKTFQYEGECQTLTSVFQIAGTIKRLDIYERCDYVFLTRQTDEQNMGDVVFTHNTETDRLTLLEYILRDQLLDFSKLELSRMNVWQITYIYKRLQLAPVNNVPQMIREILSLAKRMKESAGFLPENLIV